MTSDLKKPARRNLAAGLALIGFGALALLSQYQFMNRIELLILPALSAIFLAWGIATRAFGLVIPGSLLAGVALGSYLVERPFAAAAEPTQGGIFLLAFAVGWLLLALLSPFVAEGFKWWPLVPGGIIAFFGALLLSGDAGMKALQLLSYAWPIALIAVGAWIILRRRA